MCFICKTMLPQQGTACSFGSYAQVWRAHQHYHHVVQGPMWPVELDPLVILTETIYCWPTHLHYYLALMQRCTHHGCNFSPAWSLAAKLITTLLTCRLKKMSDSAALWACWACSWTNSWFLAWAYCQLTGKSDATCPGVWDFLIIIIIIIRQESVTINTSSFEN